MELAIQGGNPVRTKPFPAHRTIGKEEKEAICRIIDGGVLSKYLGVWHDDFMGGPEVRANEAEWAARFGAKHAIAVNSNTSGLICSVGAIGIEPGDEVIVSPYTMSASVIAPLIYGGVPVFADVEEEFFCLDPASVEAKITSRTKAILVVDIFGLPYDAKAINAIARKHGLRVIEDAAQAPGARLNDVYAGMLGDVGVFSLNYHKHIHSGEGGIIVTDDDQIAERTRLIRNHAESVVEKKGVTDLTNMVGFNFRMTEIEAAIGRCQLRKLDDLLAARLANVSFFEEKLADIPAMRPPKVREGAVHVYYQHCYRFDEKVAGVSRNLFIDAVKAELPHFELRESEGVKLGYGYVRPLYLLPMFQQKIAIGSQGLPFANAPVDYRQGICPVVERLHEKELVSHEFMVPSMTTDDLLDVVNAFEKVWELRHKLRAT